MLILPLSRTKQQSVTRKVHLSQSFRSELRCQVRPNAPNSSGNRPIQQTVFLSVKFRLIYLERGLEQCQNRTPSAKYLRSRRYHLPSANQPVGHQSPLPDNKKCFILGGLMEGIILENAYFSLQKDLYIV